MKNKILLVAAALLMCAAAYAQLATPPVLSSNMVLQQGCKVPIWGDAEPNEPGRPHNLHHIQYITKYLLTSIDKLW